MLEELPYHFEWGVLEWDKSFLQMVLKGDIFANGLEMGLSFAENGPQKGATGIL